MHRRQLVLAAVAGHFLLTGLHGVVHAAVPVFPTGWTAAFAAVSLFALPLVGAVLSVRGRRTAGAAVLFGAGVAGFAFEAAFHFLLHNPDHVAHVAAHQFSFSVTAVLTNSGDLLLVTAAWLSVRDAQRLSDEYLGPDRPIRRLFE